MDRLTTIAGITALALIAMTVTGFLAARITGTVSFYNVPSVSMVPTLPIGTHFIASIFPYWFKEPQRGDIITFAVPNKSNTIFVKRIIGLPGDTVQMRNEIILLNEKEIPKKLINNNNKPITLKQPFKNIRQYQEILPSGTIYTILEASRQSQFDNTSLFKIPAKHYFVIGDNRDNSMDSRANTALRFIPYDNIRGKLITKFPFLQFLANLVKVIEL
jgi:signal peptidase I